MIKEIQYFNLDLSSVLLLEFLASNIKIMLSKDQKVSVL